MMDVIKRILSVIDTGGARDGSFRDLVFNEKLKQSHVVACVQVTLLYVCVAHSCHGGAL
jgi:hypothetical protein